MNNFGKVYLIGAGPGDPGLFTLKGKSILEKADVVLFDRLVSPAILQFCNDNALMYDVGKMPSYHKVKQLEINKLLVKFAKEMPNSIIVRLKGGDPFVFGRGGEEALELSQSSIDFEIVPGVTSAIAVPSYAGIPVSHRGIATSFHVITGHEKLNKNSLTNESNLNSIDFQTLSKCKGTLIFLMGISNMKIIAKKLIECGMDKKTPLAFIERGTTPYQRTEMATLETASEIIDKKNIKAPAITIMGGVVELGKQLSWRKRLPLSGKKIVVTRALKQSKGMTSRLSSLGAEVIETPMIKTRIFDNPMIFNNHEWISTSILEIYKFDILVFTSVNGVESFFEQLKNNGLDIRMLFGKKIACVGHVTEKKLLEYGIKCDYVPEDNSAFGLGKLLLEKLNQNEFSSERVLLLQGSLADDTLFEFLPGAVRFVVYETQFVQDIPMWKLDAIAHADSIVFASSSAVESFVKLMGANKNNVPKISFSIGKKTTASAIKYGFQVIESENTTMDSLVKKIVEYYSE